MVASSSASAPSASARATAAHSEGELHELLGQFHRNGAFAAGGESSGGTATAGLPRGLENGWPADDWGHSAARDLAEWERALCDREADLRVREGAVARERAQLHDRLTETHAEARRVLERLRARLDFERELSVDAEEFADRESEREAFALDRQRLERLLEELLDKPRSPDSGRPRSPVDQAELRAGLASLRAVANESARRAIRRHFWQQRVRGAGFKLALVTLSFALMAALSWRHGTSAAFGPLAWGAGAIGTIALASFGTAFRRKIRNRATLDRRLQSEEAACEPGALTDPGIEDKTEIEFDTWTG